MSGLRFAAIGLNHDHIYGWACSAPAPSSSPSTRPRMTAAAFAQAYPQAKRLPTGARSSRTSRSA